MMASYNKIISKRALTHSEKDQFTHLLLGVDYKTVERGNTTGNTDDLNYLMKNAAETNGITPEQIKAIIKDMVLL